MHKAPDIFLTEYHRTARLHCHKSVDGSGPLMEMYEVVRWPDCSPSLNALRPSNAPTLRRMFSLIRDLQTCGRMQPIHQAIVVLTPSYRSSDREKRSHADFRCTHTEHHRRLFQPRTQSAPQENF